MVPFDDRNDREISTVFTDHVVFCDSAPQLIQKYHSLKNNPRMLKEMASRAQELHEQLTYEKLMTEILEVRNSSMRILHIVESFGHGAVENWLIDYLVSGDGQDSPSLFRSPTWRKGEGRSR